MIIYRWEDEKGKGPYTGNFGGITYQMEKATGRGHTDRDGRPVPLQDGIGYCDMSPNSRCGFESQDQAERWFSEVEREMLLESGFNLSMYSIERQDVAFGGHQVVFRKEYAKLIGKVYENVKCAA